MCELLGIAFNEPVTASIAFRGFRRRGERNADGWGLAWFFNNAVQIRKEPAPANQSEEATLLEKKLAGEISSPIFIGHVRLASHGSPSLANTHPFQRTLRGVPVLFAHNGTLDSLPQPRRFRPDGDTDSETAFCLLLEWMEDGAVSFNDFSRIEARLRDLNERGTMNLLFSEGTSLFVYSDKAGYNGLCFTYRRAPFQVIKLKDEDWEIDLAEEKRPSEKGFVIATRAMTDEHWEHLAKGRLLVIRDGEAIYGNART
jgi:predicted glutamine amidotransferase